MDDRDELARITELVEEERRLRGHASGGQPLSGADQARLADVEVRLDQCWDLLRQRRARDEFGADPDQATVRTEEEVEHYQQ